MKNSMIDFGPEAPVRTDSSLSKKILKWLGKNKLVAVTSAIIITLYIVGIAAEWIAPYDPLYQDFTASYETPSWDHWFGTDALGRDYFSRVLFALRTTIGITIATLLVGAGLLGVFLGLASAYRGGWTDTLIMRAGELSVLFPALMFMILISVTIAPRYHALMDDVTSWQGLVTARDLLPGLFVMFLFCCLLTVVGAARKTRFIPIFSGLTAGLLLIFIAPVWLLTVAGFSDFLLIVIVLLPFSWYGTALLIRSQALALRESDFILAAKTIGASDARIILHHLLPNVMGLVLLLFTAGFSGIALAEIHLTYLGLGVQPPNPSFGSLIFDAGFIRTLQSTPHLLIIPSAIVALFLYSYSLLGDALGKSVSLSGR